MSSVAARTMEEPVRPRYRLQPVDSDPRFIGSEKHITFGGSSAGGINIPGGLRMPVVPDRTAPAASTKVPGRPVARPTPEPIGWNRNITFGGSSAGGINIPGGLRAPAPKRAES